MNSSTLRVLLVEDSIDDYELVVRALGDLSSPVETQCVCTAVDLRRCLSTFHPHIVLSDFSMPGFSGQKALEIVRELAPDTPFIFVSGTIGEELAIDAMQLGASDYVLKGNLRRLRPAVERALVVAEERAQRRAMESALRESNERFRAIVETTGDWIWQTDAQCRLTYSNDNTEKMLGFPAGVLLGRDRREFLLPVESPAGEPPAMSEAGWRNLVRQWRHADGSIRVLESTARPMYDSDGVLVGYRGVDRDVTLRVQQETRIEHLVRMHAVLSAFGNAILRSEDTEALLDMTCRLLVEQGRFAVAMVCQREADGRFAMSNHFGHPQLAARIAALGAVDLESDDSLHRPSVRAFTEARPVIISGDGSGQVPDDWRAESRQFGLGAQASIPIGEPPWAVLSVRAGKAQEFNDDEVALLERLCSEIDYARGFIAKSDQLEYIAYHNPTTGLPSRSAFHQMIEPRIACNPHAVAMADVNRFRYYNQTRGRAFGDQLLCAVAERLKSLLPDDALLAHPGDDAFVFAYDSDAGIDSVAADVATLLHQCTERPFEVDGEQVRIKLHGSVLLAPVHAVDGEAIERGLVDVLAEAQSGESRVLAYTEDVRRRSARRVEIENELRRAIEQGEFELFLQPKFNAVSRSLVSVEALLRWRHPERGLVSPAEFIPVLEDTGLIVEVGAWVRQEGLSITRRWRELGKDDLRLAVNVSVRELRQLDFVGELEQMLSSVGGDHELDIEITESMLMDDIEQSIRTLDAVRGLGCQVAIDDFGTGYSSLNYLSRLPADTLKIDRSFVNLLAHSPDTVSLVTNIISLAHSLGLRVVAEGVEDEEQAKLLRLLRCDELQGYLLGRPMPVAEFEQRYLVQ